jgi:hypothetical protein
MGIGKFLKKLSKQATPIIGSALGTMFGGPAGAIAGGALLGSTTRGGKNKLKGALHGGLTGAAYSALAPMVGEAFGVQPYGGFLSDISGLSSPSLLNQLGISSAPGIGGGIGLMGNVGTAGLLESLSPAASGGLGLLSQFGDAAAKAVQAKKQDFVPNRDEYQDFLDDSFMNHQSGHGNNRRGDASSLHGYQDIASRALGPDPKLDHRALALMGQLKPKKKNRSIHESLSEELNKPVQHQKIVRKNMPTTGLEMQTPRYARGGNVKLGYIKEGTTDGQADDIPAYIPNKSYVMNATDLSLFGNGSSENGAIKFSQFERKTLTKKSPKKYQEVSSYTKPYDDHQKNIKAWVSNDEYVVHPKTVEKLGNGNFNKGAKVLDKMRSNLRKQKGVKQILPPKTKNLSAYLPKKVANANYR